MQPIEFYVDLFVMCALMPTCYSETTFTLHKTQAAIEKQHDLWCYKCDSMFDGDRCLEVTTANHSTMHQKCSKEQKKCQVHRISMSTSTDEITGKPKLWLLQRNCSEMCEPGCIVIGERTKLHSCITCCDERNYCNAGNGAVGIQKTLSSSFAVIFIISCRMALAVVLSGLG